MPSTLTTVRDTIRRETNGGHFLRDHVLFENFSELPSTVPSATASKHFIYGGTGTVQFASLAGGGITMTTRAATAVNDTARIVPASTSGWAKTTAPTEQPVLDIVVYTPAVIGDAQFYAGWKLTGTNVIATDADQALFLYDTANTTSFGPAGVGTITASANWLAVVSIAGDDVDIDTGIPVVAATNYRFTISIDSNRLARFYIDGVPVYNGGAVYTSGALTAAAAMLAQVGGATRDAGPAVRSVGIRSMRLQRPYL